MAFWFKYINLSTKFMTTLLIKKSKLIILEVHNDGAIYFFPLWRMLSRTNHLNKGSQIRRS